MGGVLRYSLALDRRALHQTIAAASAVDSLGIWLPQLRQFRSTAPDAGSRRVLPSPAEQSIGWPWLPGRAAALPVHL